MNKNLPVLYLSSNSVFVTEDVSEYNKIKRKKENAEACIERKNQERTSYSKMIDWSLPCKENFLKIKEEYPNLESTFRTFYSRNKSKY